jgi:hypothetical protein
MENSVKPFFVICKKMQKKNALNAKKMRIGLLTPRKNVLKLIIIGQKF